MNIEHRTSNIEVEIAIGIAIGIEFLCDRIGSGYNEICNKTHREAVASSLLVAKGQVFDSDPDSDFDFGLSVKRMIPRGLPRGGFI